MRPSSLRARVALAATGALCIGTTIAAPSGAAHPQSPGGSTARPVTIAIKDRTLRYGQRVDVRGRVAGAPGRQLVALQLQRRGVWQTLVQGRTGGRGRFRLRAKDPATGRVRVVAGDVAVQLRAAGTSGGGAPLEVSRASRVAVRADVVPQRRVLDVVAGRRVVVRGKIRPAVGGHRVVLQLRTARGWRAIAWTRTRAHGGFGLAARVGTPLSAGVRIRVGGGDGLVTGRERVGRLNVYRYAVVSWYGPGLYGNPLACGGRLYPGTLGVANKSLPCGTMVTLRYRGRSVRVAVIDRGPYVAGREYDLTAATKDRLGFAGVGAILVTR